MSFAAGVAAGLVVLGGIWIGVAVTAGVQAQQQADYEACMTELGFLPVTSDTDLEAAVEAAEICS